MVSQKSHAIVNWLKSQKKCLISRILVKISLGLVKISNGLAKISCYRQLLKISKKQSNFTDFGLHLGGAVERRRNRVEQSSVESSISRVQCQEGKGHEKRGKWQGKKVWGKARQGKEQSKIRRNVRQESRHNCTTGRLSLFNAWVRFRR